MSGLCPWPFVKDDPHRPHVLGHVPPEVHTDPRFQERVCDLVAKPHQLNAWAERCQAACEVCAIRQAERAKGASS